ncbi:MAG TPA: hypothetical protein DGG95_05970, partial [Cytophagales bacterium]|nr:hypothetical protein [Cytophagales bacterium]
SIIKQKAAPQTNGVIINGIAVKPDKFFEMMDLDSADFISEFQSTQEYIKSVTTKDTELRRLGVTFLPDFFQLKGNLFQTSEDFFNKWVDSAACIFTNNEAQVKVYHQVNKICDAINEMMEIKGTPSPRGVNCETIKRNPLHLIDEGGLLKIAKLENGKFCFDHRFILNH